MCTKFTAHVYETYYKGWSATAPASARSSRKLEIFDREKCCSPSPADDARRSPRSGHVNQKINTPYPPLLQPLRNVRGKKDVKRLIN